MNELNSGKIKITNDGNIIMQFSNYHHVIDSDTELYYKHQADKVIAELEKNLSEIQSQKMQLEDDVALLRRNNTELKKERNWLAKDRAQAYDDLEKRAQLNIKQEESIRHQKYKRCLAMALLWLDRSENSTDLENELVSRRRYGMWLELAEKFKEAK